MLIKAHQDKQVLRPRIASRFSRALKCLESHHSAPRYRVAAYQLVPFLTDMSWKNQRWQNSKAEQWKASWNDQDLSKGQQKKKEKDRASKDQQQEKHVLIGYDGRKVEIKQPGSALSSSSSPASAAEENKVLKEAVKYLLSKTPEPEEVPAAVKSLIAVDPRAELRQRQKELNQEKKALTRVEKLKAEIVKQEERYAAWKTGMDTGIQQEEARFQKEIHQLQVDLKTVEKDEKEGRYEMDEGSSNNPANQRLAQEMDTMKQNMIQMASYVQSMEQRNMELANQVQSLVVALKSSNGLEMPANNSPQMVHRPRRAEREGSLFEDHRERSRSPAKRSAEEAHLEAAEVLDLERQEAKEIISTIPEPHRAQLIAIVKSEPASYQTIPELWNLVIAFQTQLAAQVSLPKEEGVSSVMTTGEPGTAMLPFRMDARKKKVTGLFSNELD